MNTSKWALAAALAATFATANAADRSDFGVSHYETLGSLQLRTMAADGANLVERSNAGPRVMSFDAMGRRFDLELELNGRLMDAARRNPLLDGVGIYRGEVAGSDGSWVRLVVADGVPSGMFFDGTDYYAIEAPGDSVVASDTPIIYRLADAWVAPGAMTCGSAAPVTSAAAAVEMLVSEIGGAAQAQGAISEITMGAIGDFEFTHTRGDAAAASAITTRLNNVDGIFSSQVGVQINVQVIETFNTDTDPFTTNVAEDLLDEVSAYRSATSAQNSNGLTHLYTGRNLDGTTVGIAWTGALCSNYFGAGLSEGNSGAMFDSLVAAHEIGHNFGAPHDGESGSACESQTGDWLMSPRLNGVDQFSSCSLSEMADDINRASCITALPAVDVDIALQSSATLLFGADTDLSYEIGSNGTLDAANVAVDFAIPATLAVNSAAAASGTCTTGAGTVSCSLGNVPGLAVRTVDINVSPAALGAVSVSATVTTDSTDERPGNNQVTTQLTVNPAVDLVAGAPSGATVKVDKSTTIAATLENRATMDASGVSLTVDLGNALRATAANWPLGTCNVTAQRVTCQAATFAAQSSSSVSVSATGVSAGNPNITVTLTSIEADLVPGDNTGSGRLEVKDSSNEGSGSTGPLFLLLLGLVAAFRRRA